MLLLLLLESLLFRGAQKGPRMPCIAVTSKTSFSQPAILFRERKGSIRQNEQVAAASELFALFS